MKQEQEYAVRAAKRARKKKKLYAIHPGSDKRHSRGICLNMLIHLSLLTHALTSNKLSFGVL